MSRSKFLAGMVIVLLGSALGVGSGRAFLRVANAKDKVNARRAKAARSAQVATPAPCPAITTGPLTVWAEDYSSNEGLLAPGHGKSQGGSVQVNISGLPPRTAVPVTLTFNLSHTQVANTSADRGSIAHATAYVYLSGLGANFIIRNSTLAGQGGSSGYVGGVLPSGTLQFTVMATNGSASVGAFVQAAAATSKVDATASASVMLDFLGASFATSSSSANATVRSTSQNGYGNCPYNCGQLSQDIESRARELESRYNALLSDPFFLYCNHYFAVLIINGNNLGSYFGHMLQYEEKQRNLIKQINNAAAKGCYVSDFAAHWASQEVPTRPKNPPCMHPGG